MALINSTISCIMKRRIQQIEYFKTNPHKVQSELFKKLIDEAKNTEWGKKYHYNSINNYDEFKNSVPVSTYENLKKYIYRIQNGEQNILWNSKIELFAKSSGTTNSKSKFIPLSNESLLNCHFKGGKDLLSTYFKNYPDSQMFDGKGIAMIGKYDTVKTKKHNYYVGDLSALMLNKFPPWIQYARIPQRKTVLLHEWESKIEQMAQQTINVNVVPSWILLFLKRVLTITGKNNILEVWPNMEAFFHGGVNFSPYLDQYKQLIPSAKMRYINTYNASEGFFGIQDKIDSDELLLFLDHGIFYEFMPLNQLGKENPKTYQLDEIEIGNNYAMIISTNGGLWRYIIGDTVEFTSLNPFRIKITGRTQNFINAFGEEIIIANAEKALASACKKTKAIINEYTAGPIYFNKNENAAHEWLIEFETQPNNLNLFTETLDNCLKSLNSDYEAKRYHDMILHKPIINILPKDTFYNWLKIRGKLGGQNKVPRLANNRKYIEEILELSKSKTINK